MSNKTIIEPQQSLTRPLADVLREIIQEGSPRKPSWIELTGPVLAIRLNLGLQEDPVEFEGVTYNGHVACYTVFVPDLGNDCLIYVLDGEALTVALTDIERRAFCLLYAGFGVSHLCKLNDGPHGAILRVPRFKRYL